MQDQVLSAISFRPQVERDHDGRQQQPQQRVGFGVAIRTSAALRPDRRRCSRTAADLGMIGMRADVGDVVPAA